MATPIQSGRHCAKLIRSYKTSCGNSNAIFERLFQGNHLFRTHAPAVLFMNGINGAFDDLPDVSQLTVPEAITEAHKLRSLRFYADECRDGRQKHIDECITEERRDVGHSLAIDIFTLLVERCEGRLFALEEEVIRRRDIPVLNQEAVEETASSQSPKRKIYGKKKKKNKQNETKSVQFTDDVMEFLELSVLENRKIVNEKTERQREFYGIVIDKLYDILEKFKVADLDAEDISGMATAMITFYGGLEKAAISDWDARKMLNNIAFHRNMKKPFEVTLQKITDIIQGNARSMGRDIHVDETCVRKILACVVLGAKEDLLYSDLINGNPITKVPGSVIAVTLYHPNRLVTYYDILKKSYTMPATGLKEDQSCNTDAIAEWARSDGFMSNIVDARTVAHMSVNALGLLKTNKFPWTDANNVTLMNTLLLREYVWSPDVVKFLTKINIEHVESTFKYCKRLFLYDNIDLASTDLSDE